MVGKVAQMMMKVETLKPGWKAVKFGDVVKLSNMRCANPSVEGIERYVGLEHIEPNDLRIRRWGLVENGITFTTCFKPGQVLFGKRRAYQRKVAVADFEGVCSGDIYVFESINPKVLLPELLPFICQTECFFEYAVGTSAGSLSPRTNWKSLTNFEFYLPPLEEQKKVAKLLILSKDLEEEINILAFQHQILKSSLIEKRVQELAKGGITQLKREINRIESGKSPGSLGRSAGEDEFGVLKVSAVGNWDYHAEENKLISESEYLIHLEVKPGDLLATRANADPDSVGRTCLVRHTRSGLMLSDKTWRLDLKDPKNTAGILALTKSSMFRKYVRSVLGGTEAKNISQTAFLNAPFPDCLQNEFRAFSSEIEAILETEYFIQERVKNARKVSKILINKILGL